MATVEILYDDTAKHLEKYLKEKGKDSLTTEHSCFLDGMTKTFSQAQSDYNSKGNNALHLIQSWSPEESKTLTPEQVHKIGTEMAKRFAPGHQFVVQTHTDRAHQNQDGRNFLKDRDHVEISDYSWTNHRNKTRGTLIDFVANHRSTSLLHAISLINDNPNLMLLEKHMGQVQRSYKPFHIPIGDSAKRSDSVLHLASFLGHARRQDYSSLFRNQSIQVTSDFKIRFFFEKSVSGYLEYSPQKVVNLYNHRIRDQILLTQRDIDLLS